MDTTIDVINIIPGVELSVYGGSEAELRIGAAAVAFEWNAETRQLFENVDVAESIEVLALLAEYSR